MSCPHIDPAYIQAPTASTRVHREDCTECFDSIDDPTGLDVCLSCFNGGCTSDRNHSMLHYRLSKHPLALNIRRTKKQKPERNEPPQKMSKLSIEAETESDKYDTVKTVKCHECGGKEIESASGVLETVVDAVMSSMTSARQDEVKAWEQELVACEHTLCLEQDVPKQLEAQNLAHCADCELKENLWLCLQCGNLGCGRAQFGGVGGNGHGLAHFNHSSHPIAVKLGSITPEGTADVYCYVCNDEKVDPELGVHLAYWGINIAEREKTEKSLTEMQIEQNLKWEFSMTTEDGKELKPVFGKGLTGLKNLGNSCYLNSVLQCLFSLPQLQERYFVNAKDHPIESLNPAEDLEIQLRKVADGLLSGRYSRPDSNVISSHDSAEIPHQKGLAPSMLKYLIGRGHEEFSTMRQQDAFELLLHLFKNITRTKQQGLTDPVSAFKFALEQRLQCLSCKRVSYKTDIQDNISVPVPVRRIAKETIDMKVEQEAGKEIGAINDAFEPVTLKECLDVFTGEEILEYTCKACGSKEGAKKSSKFKTLPEVLVVNCRRFELVNWVPTKLDVPVVIGDDPIAFDAYVSNGLQPGEEELPEEKVESSTPKFIPNQSAMTSLQEMGFPAGRCEKALYNTGNLDVDSAMNWLFAHMDDPDIDEPLQVNNANENAISVDLESVEMLGAMGFTEKQAMKALKETGGNMERAVEWLFSHPDETGEDLGPESPAETGSGALPGNLELPLNFQLDSIVCHKGGSIHAGHYVAFVRKQLEGDDAKAWILFNDEKVVKALDVDEMKKFAYVYFFKRV